MQRLLAHGAQCSSIFYIRPNSISAGKKKRCATWSDRKGDTSTCIARWDHPWYWYLSSMSSPEISGQGDASSGSFFGLSSRKKKKIVYHRSPLVLWRPAVTYQYTHLGTSPGISDPLIAHSVAPQYGSLSIRCFFFLLRYDVAQYCMVLYKTRLQRCTDSQGSGRSGKCGRARFRTYSTVKVK
jgi:hypothetical protein